MSNATIRVATSLLLALCAALACTVQAQTPGSLDTTPFPGFASGAGKIANLAIGSGADHVRAVAVQPDGRIVLAGDCADATDTDFCIARLNTDGSLDQSFDGPNGDGNGKFLLSFSASFDNAVALALQPDGKIVVFGSCISGGSSYFCLTRLLQDGSLDASFSGPGGNGNGKFVLANGAATDYASAMALQPDGRILLAGSCYNGVNFDFCAARLNPNGSFDSTFIGPGGSAVGRFLVSFTADDDYLSAVALQADGKIVLAGTCRNGSASDFCVARLNTDGTLDASFNGPSGSGNGKFLLAIGAASDYEPVILLQPDSKIVLAGYCQVGSDFDFCAARLNSNGSLDPLFSGPSGTGNGKIVLAVGTSFDQLYAAALQPDGKIVLAGECSGAANYDFCVVRLNVDGSLDASFDGPGGSANGKFLLPIGALHDGVRAMALQPDGKIVLAGSCSNGTDYDFCVARLFGGPFAYKSCSMDIDGDGKFLGTTDALIMTRIALGFTGTAALNGITFAPTATRTTWPSIGAYLVMQCGLSLVP